MGSWGWASEQGGGLCHASAELPRKESNFYVEAFPFAKAQPLDALGWS